MSLIPENRRALRGLITWRASADQANARRPRGWGLLLAGALALSACGTAPDEEAPPGERTASSASGLDEMRLPPLQALPGAPIASDAEGEDDPDPGEAPAVEESLARLDALKLFDRGHVIGTQTVHAWVPYGGFWSEGEVELEEEAVAERLHSFVAIAEEVVKAHDGLPLQADDLCFPAGDDSWCLTRDMHGSDLAALNALEVVELEGIVREEHETSAACYSSWDTVPEEDCKRATIVRSLVEATSHLPSSTPPEGEGW